MSEGGTAGNGGVSRIENRMPWRAVVLTNRSDFEAVLRSGSRIASRNFVLRARPNDAAHARLGIIAARKAAARAVDRNRGKRLIREAFRSALPVMGAYDVTVQLRNSLRDESAAALRAELSALLEGFVRRCADPAQPKE